MYKYNGLVTLPTTDSVNNSDLDPMATLYCTETVPISQTSTQILIQIPNHYFAHF